MQALIIAFTSEFIPKLVYVYVYSKDGTLSGYTDFTLSYFDPNDFADIEESLIDHHPKTCRYFDYREPPSSADPYKRKDVFWHVLAARLAFVVIFQVCLKNRQLVSQQSKMTIFRRARHKVKEMPCLSNL